MLLAIRNPSAVNEKLSKELKLGRIAGPFSEKPLSSLRLSPLGLIPKKAPGEFRLIHHLSFPYGTSVNSHILIFLLKHLQFATHQSTMLLGLLGAQAGAVRLQRQMSKMLFD